LADANAMFTNNSWGTGSDVNYYDIAILNASTNNYTDIVTMSNNNNGAIIENQHSSYSFAILSIVHVDAAASPSGSNGSVLNPYPTIASSISRVAPGGKILIAAGNYAGDISIPGKSISLVGAGSGPGGTTVSGTTNGFTIGGVVSKISFKDLAITNASNSGIQLLSSANITQLDISACKIANNQI